VQYACVQGGDRRASWRSADLSDTKQDTRWQMTALFPRRLSVCRLHWPTDHAAAVLFVRRTATLNTDLKVFLSANNGTNYTQVTLVAQTLPSATNIIKEVDSLIALLKERDENGL